MQMPIPQDWDGDDWRCVEVWWPNSPLYIGILQGLLTDLTRGRFWDASTGSIKSAQAIAFEIFARNLPLNPCRVCPGDGEQPSDGPSEGGGVVIEECDDMGQVVTDITIEGGVLYKWFGPCCKIPVGTIPGNSVNIPDGDDNFPPPEEEPFYTCRKAWYMADWLIQVAGKVYTVSDDLIPLPTAVMLEFPQITFHIGYLINALQKAGDVDADEWQESDQEFYRQTLACRWVPLLENDTSGLTDDQWDAMRTVAETAFGADVGEMLEQTMLAIGQGDLSDLGLSGLYDDNVDCTCPPGAGGGDVAGVVWTGSITINREDGTYTFLRRFNGGLSAEHRFVTEIGSYKALDIDHLIDVELGTEVDDILIAFQPVLPSDELLHHAWLSSGCAVIDTDSLHGELDAVDRTEQNITPSGGWLWYEEVWSSPKTALTWQSGESRSCPQNQTEAKTYQWIAHIARVNGVSTGVVAIPPGI
jgi:hypothetical protein